MSRKFIIAITLGNIVLVAYLLFLVLGSSGSKKKTKAPAPQVAVQTEESVDSDSLWMEYGQQKEPSEAISLLSRIEKLSPDLWEEAWQHWNILSKQKDSLSWQEQQEFLQMMRRSIEPDLAIIDPLEFVALNRQLSLSLREYALRMLVDLSLEELSREVPRDALAKKLAATWTHLFQSLLPEDNQLAAFTLLAFSHLLKLQKDRQVNWLEADLLALWTARLIESPAMHDLEINNVLLVIGDHQLSPFTPWLRSLLQAERSRVLPYDLRLEVIKTLQALGEVKEPPANVFSPQEERLYWSK